MNVQQMLDEERALEEKLFGTPTTESPNSEVATTVEPEENSAPLKDEEAGTTSPKAVEPTEKPGEDWEKRFKGLRASREKKLYEAQTALAENQNLLVSLQEQLDNLQSQVVKPQAVSVGDILSDEEKDSLGDTAISAIEKAAHAISDSKTKGLEEELATIRENSKSAAKDRAKLEADNAYGTFLTRLATAVPNYEELNTDAKFVGYLDELDIDGTPRLENLRSAERRGDVATVARFMLDYKATQVAPSKLDELVTPKQTASPQTKPTEDKGYLTMKEINAHYDKHTRGGYKGREKEFLDMEHKIDTYAATGRIR